MAGRDFGSFKLVVKGSEMDVLRQAHRRTVCVECGNSLAVIWEYSFVWTAAKYSIFVLSIGSPVLMVTNGGTDVLEQ